MLLANIILIGILIFVLVVFITMMTSLILFVPFIPSPQKVVAFMVEKARLKGDEIVYDLGCGDARLLILTKRRYPHIRAIGYELALGAWIIAKLRVLASGKNITVKMRDFFQANLADADVIFLYLIPEVMGKLERKLNAELRRGTRVISHGFEFKGKTPVSIERCPLPSWHFFKQQGKTGPRVYVYEW